MNPYRYQIIVISLTIFFLFDSSLSWVVISARCCLVSCCCSLLSLSLSSSSSSFPVVSLSLAFAFFLVLSLSLSLLLFLSLPLSLVLFLSLSLSLFFIANVEDVSLDLLCSYWFFPTGLSSGLRSRRRGLLKRIRWACCRKCRSTPRGGSGS